ncbi:hypothetical protein [Virgibacillus sp. LDC-1]|uniref:hypothetical protein n=1 Tax=Virgibacillus sp. LDC-1 TaxID=3039856 RepID=UPI0024DEAC1D|nr:hypothetical protein [Virgibacillus sp. LDC-1]
MNKWFYLNLALLITAIWQLVKRSYFHSISLFLWLGFIGLLLFLFNWTRHAVFSTIRNAPRRKTKIKFANISKKALPYHKWSGTAALLLILCHAIWIMNKYGILLDYPKMFIGILAGLTLIIQVSTGWLRQYWPSGLKRKVHLYGGMLLFFLIFVHIIL